MKLALKILLPLLFLAVGVAVFIFLVKTRPHAARRSIVHLDPLVEVVPVGRDDEQVVVTGMGGVVAARTTTIQPEVSGRIVELHENVVRGGHVSAGDTLLRVDPRNYELSVEQKKVSLANAEFEARVEKGRARVARREWKLLGDEIDRSEADEDMALRRPHAEAAEAAIRGATAALERAELDVERTEIEVPFNAIVQNEGVEIGQLVSPQTQVATLVGTDEFWVEVAVPADALPWIEIPGLNADAGSPATIRQSLGAGGEAVRQGEVVRLLSSIDPVGRMIRLIVAVPDPLAVSDEAPVPLLTGAYVQVDIAGRMADDVVALPRKGLRNGRQAWVVDEDRHLHIRELEILWRRGEDVLVRDGLQAGDRVVLTRLSSPAEGMGLRIEGEPYLTFLLGRLWQAWPESWRPDWSVVENAEPLPEPEPGAETEAEAEVETGAAASSGDGSGAEATP